MSTLLSQAISFRLLIKQLSKDEFLTLMSKIFDMNQSNLISTSLFNHFINEASLTNPNNDNLNNIHSMLSEIIQSRKPKPKSLPIIDVTLDKIPKTIVGHMASFLSHNDYVSFQKINRRIFIACNSPNMLIKLDLKNATNYSAIDLSQFKSLKRLTISLPKFNELQLTHNGGFVLNELECLHLVAHRKKDFDIEPFMKQNGINITNIKNVSFSYFGSHTGHVRDHFDADKFWKLLTAFENVNFLGFVDCLPTKKMPTQKVKELLKSHADLKVLSIEGGEKTFNNDLMQTFGNNLQTLCLDFYPRTEFDFSNINFKKLQQVILTAPSIKTVNDILKLGQNIQQFSLFPIRTDVVSPQKENLKTIIPEIFKCKLLKYFEITVNNQNYLSIFDGIESGLYDTKRLERKQMKIRVNAWKNIDINLKHIMISIARIVNWLEKLKIKDFMFIFDMRDVSNKCKQQFDATYILKELNDISTNVKVGNDGLWFVITNENCKICGYQQPCLKYESLFNNNSRVIEN